MMAENFGYQTKLIKCLKRNISRIVIISAKIKTLLTSGLEINQSKKKHMRWSKEIVEMGPLEVTSEETQNALMASNHCIYALNP